MVTREQHYVRARRVMPGGVNSSTRLNQALGTPFFASRAAAGRVWDIEGREFIDLCCAHGAALLGQRQGRDADHLAPAPPTGSGPDRTPRGLS